MISIPADDSSRTLTVADPDGAGVPHVSVAGGLQHPGVEIPDRDGEAVTRMERRKTSSM
jgi:hypothetical protein